MRFLSLVRSTTDKSIAWINQIVMIIIFYFKVLFSIVAGEKRLLLNDPDVIAHRLESLEQKVLTLEADLGTEKQTVQQMSAKIQELSGK